MAGQHHGVGVSFVREVRNIRPYVGPKGNRDGYKYTADVMVFDGQVKTIDVNPTMGAGSNRWHDHGNGDFHWDDYATSKMGAWVRVKEASHVAAQPCCSYQSSCNTRGDDPMATGFGDMSRCIPPDELDLTPAQRTAQAEFEARVHEIFPDSQGARLARACGGVNIRTAQKWISFQILPPPDVLEYVDHQIEELERTGYVKPSRP